MCGMVGYLGNRRALPVLMQAVKMMKDVSYDSAGIMLKGAEGILLRKKVGQLAALENELIDYAGQETIGAIHLRWATHGEINLENAHPITDCEGNIIVMHKGLIENYAELKDVLTQEGHKFKTGTDSEVLTHLIEKNYTGDLMQAVRQALQKVEGTYGIIVLRRDDHLEMVAANAGAGMMVGIGDGEYFISLDKKIIYPFTDKVIYLGDNELVRIDRNGYYTSAIAGGDINIINRQVEVIDNLGNGKAEYFAKVEKEMFEQPNMVRNTLAGRIDESKSTAHFGGLINYQDLLRRTNRLIFVGSGSSYYVAMLAREIVEDYVALGVSVYSGLEMRYKRFSLSSTDSVLFVLSQSGQTENTVAAMREAMQLGMHVFGITNTVGSTVAKETESGIFIHSGPTLGIPSLRSFMAQLVIVVLLTLHIGRLKGLSPASGKSIIDNLKRLPDEMRPILAKSYGVKNAVKQYVNSKRFWVVGVKYGYPIALEAAMILGKLGGVRAEGVNVAELEFGLINQIDPEDTVLFVLPNDELYDMNLRILRLIRKTGAKVVVFTEEDDNRLKTLQDDRVFVPAVKDIVMPIMMLMSLQMWIYYLGRELAFNNENKSAAKTNDDLSYYDMQGWEEIPF